MVLDRHSIAQTFANFNRTFYARCEAPSGASKPELTVAGLAS